MRDDTSVTVSSGCAIVNSMPTLHCYLLHEDGRWYDMGEYHRWGTAFIGFPWWDGRSVMLGPEDVPRLALTLSDYGHEPAALERLAADIIRWANEGKNPKAVWIDDALGKFNFVTELDAEVEPGVQPSPMTGSALRLLGGARTSG